MCELRTGIVFLLFSVSAGCGTLPDGHGWGQQATLLPGWDRIRSAAWNAASSPHVWAPVGAALLLQIDGADEAISEWAVEETPLFGSNQKATDASDALNAFSFVMLGATALATPSGDSPGEWSASKLKGTAVELSAPLLASGTTELLKSAVGRTRPNLENDRSFPSGHTSAAAANSLLAIRNTDHLLIPGWAKTTLKTGFATLPYATGWARIEGGHHYPSDVLAGAAIGNFFGAFVNDAFMGVDSPDDLHLTISQQPDGLYIVGLARRF